jgi:putative ABC transport system permease protein
MVAAAAIDAELGAYPPETRGDRTLLASYARLQRRNDPHKSSSNNLGYELIDRYLRPMTTPERIGVLSEGWGTVAYTGADQLPVSRRYMDGACWEILQFEFLEGRPFTVQEDAEGAPLAVINQATRDRLFGGLPALGRTIQTALGDFRVVGVVRNVSEARTVFADVWLPLGTVSWPREGLPGMVNNLEVLLLARSPADLPKVKAEFQTRIAQVDLTGVAPYEELIAFADTPFERLARSVHGYSSEETAAATVRLVATLSLAALLFMLLPALNLVNLNLSRILERGSEIGVRRSFGAPRRSLVWQLLVENVVLTLAGGVLGGMLSVLVLHTFSWWGWAQFLEFHLSPRVFLCGLGVTLAFGLLSGAYPAWRMARLHPVAALRGERR